MGLFQLLLAPMFVGYFLSIYWGYLIVKKAFTDSPEFAAFLNNAQAKSDAPPAGINIGGNQPGGFAFGNNSGMANRR